MLQWFQTSLELPGGIPSHDTFGDVFARLDPEQFHQLLDGLDPAIASCCPWEVVAIDGKTARRSHDCALARHAPVSAWATQNTLTLGQVRTAESPMRSPPPQLLNLLDLQGVHRDH